MIIKTKPKMGVVAFRARQDVIDKVKALAQWERERGNTVNEADVYRAILETFFSAKSTDSSEGKAS
jgi:hypothetical protein